MQKNILKIDQSHIRIAAIIITSVSCTVTSSGRVLYCFSAKQILRALHIHNQGTNYLLDKLKTLRLLQFKSEVDFTSSTYLVVDLSYHNSDDTFCVEFSHCFLNFLKNNMRLYDLDHYIANCTSNV